MEFDGGREGISGRRESILFPTAEETAELFLTRAGTVLGADGATAARAEIEALPGLADVRQLTSTLRPERAIAADSEGRFSCFPGPNPAKVPALAPGLSIAMMLFMIMCWELRFTVDDGEEGL